MSARHGMWSNVPIWALYKKARPCSPASLDYYSSRRSGAYPNRRKAANHALDEFVGHLCNPETNATSGLGSRTPFVGRALDQHLDETLSSPRQALSRAAPKQPWAAANRSKNTSSSGRFWFLGSSPARPGSGCRRSQFHGYIFPFFPRKSPTYILMYPTTRNLGRTSAGKHCGPWLSILRLRLATHRVPLSAR